MIKMNIEAFTGKALDYSKARPGYPIEAIEYIHKLARPNTIFADIGAGTGKFTELLARYGYEIYAIEPNIDMGEQLIITLSSFPNTKIVYGTAEGTTLSDNSIDFIICAQSIGWFNLDAFRLECYRIGKPDATIISIYNCISGDNYNPSNNRMTNKRATEIFFRNPVIREYSNPIYYSREKWLQSNASISDNPQPSDIEYDTHIAKINKIFDRDNVNGILKQNFTTKMYIEKVNKINDQMN
jgi:ubiquinone/menaquinone biosynthesis C-methylase UbiE